jgi:hypothetical protein
MSLHTTCDSVQLVVMAMRARELNTNRQGNVDWLKENLDPDGTHVCEMAFPHSEHEKERLDMRAKWLCKVKNTMKPHVLWIDIPMEEYSKLTSAENNKK